MKSPLIDKKVFAWALYDWANSAFATSVMVVFFPLFFKQFLTPGQEASVSTAWLAYANGISSFVLALMAPFILAFGDDQTDEDLFAALPAGSVAIHVGPGDSRAPLRVAGVKDVRVLLRGLLG